jgi:uncharacterized protein (TIGR03086 family)
MEAAIDAPIDREAVQRACASTDRFVAGIPPESLTAPTPCAPWTVRDLLNHLVGTLVLGEALLGDHPPAVAMRPGDLPASDLLGDDALAAYRAHVPPLLAAATPESIGRVHATPLGDMPGTVLAGFTALDVLVHGWDVARSTGQPAELDAALAEQALGFARQTISDEMGTRAPRIGPEVPVAPGASATDRLVAFLGRVP